ncbi:beta-galactosidase [Paenibacillus campinasensis]|uniref:Beta-galactosidase n=1 Tax=Paenibacillus campinasensis TaxID=66347 RepID=A0ABW9T210_9BACL|nr:beta-galactosidase [Paenibacillus campinasensis]MUG66170.1 beta-galactosidase [Paenibacillus campinasensis]
MSTQFRFSSFHPAVTGLLHGGDYNPDQWLAYPDIIQEDYRLMKLANCNAFTLNVFGWSAIEPEEGRYEFGWLDQMMDNLAERGIQVILATPSGARPAWMSAKYPEVLRVQSNRQRNLHGHRHNHCLTSPVYREKTREINRRLAERYKHHPALILWHISNEFGGDCHCDLCQEAFRQWLKRKYGTLEKLNHAWWTGFWSHTFTDWTQIESPAPHGEDQVHGHNLDWKRFVTDQTIDFYRNEIAPLREITPNVPVTTNFMGDYPHMGPYIGLNYAKFGKEVDVVSWDSYPTWHHDAQSTADLAADVAFVHDIYRSMKEGQPFLVMENTPSLVNWQQVNKTKRPGMHALSAVQSLAHGADAILYFQWRKGRGASEKFHGAVVGHSGHEHTRVFREVAELGDILRRLGDIQGTSVKPEVAVIYDWENQWAMDDAQALKPREKRYIETCQAHYKAFWKRGIPVDIIDMDNDFSSYKLVIAPMLYMIRPGVAERLEQFVQKGGTLVATYWSGIVDESDLTFLGGFPGPLRSLLGIWAEEIDTLYDSDRNSIRLTSEALGLDGTYEAREYCEVIHAETAEVLAAYASDYYEGMPALTVNTFGRGQAYYIASRNEDRFHQDFYDRLAQQLGIRVVLDAALPDGVSVQMRSDGESEYVFIMNFSEVSQRVDLPEHGYEDVLGQQPAAGELILPKYGFAVLRRQAIRYNRA